MELSQQVYQYYKNNRRLLSEDKQFHFATRMVAWTGDDELKLDLKNLRSMIIPDSDYKKFLKEILEKEQSGRRNAHELRQQYFQRFPKLYGAHLALFRVRHMKQVYGVDAREELFSLISKQGLLDMRDAILADAEATKILSTFAINFTYLLNDMVDSADKNLPLETIYDLRNYYNLDNLQHIQLLIYLYTHCIIGDSGFYTRKVASENIAIYQKMLSVLEDIIEKRFEDINLDNKFEFLVCAKMVDYQAQVSQKIYKEAQRSVSPEGMFIIDMLNNNIQEDRMSFDKSEHRNVLFIMSNSEYSPHSTLI